MINANTKNDCVTVMAYIWGFVLVIFPFVSVKIIPEMNPISGGPGLVILYLAYKQQTKPRGTAKLSILSIFYFFICFVSLTAGAAEVFLNKDFYYIVLLVIGVGHFYLGRWAYQNLDTNS